MLYRIKLIQGYSQAVVIIYVLFCTISIILWSIEWVNPNSATSFAFPLIWFRSRYFFVHKRICTHVMIFQGTISIAYILLNLETVCDHLVDVILNGSNQSPFLYDIHFHQRFYYVIVGVLYLTHLLRFFWVDNCDYLLAFPKYKHIMCNAQLRALA